MAEVDWVYYALAATAERLLVKIGHSKALYGRRYKLSEMPGRQRPIILAVEDGGAELERQRHIEFTRYRVGGEWFKYKGALRRHIAGLEPRVDEALAPPPAGDRRPEWLRMSPGYPEGYDF